MRCTVKKTVETVRKAGHHYVVAVKGNCSKLYRCFKQLSLENALSYTIDEQRHKGRVERRETWVYSTPPAVSEEWSGACRMVVQRRTGYRQNKRYEETAFYLSSVKRNEADYFAAGIRGHWSIENRLHWVKDVQQGEDRSGLHNIQACILFSLFRSVGLTLYRLHSEDKWKEAVAKYGNRLDRLNYFFRT